MKISITIEPSETHRLTLDYEMTGDTFRITGGRVFEPGRPESLAAAGQDWGDQFRRDLDEALSSVPPEPVAQPAPSAPLVYCPMDEPAGVRVDVSGNGHHLSPAATIDPVRSSIPRRDRKDHLVPPGYLSMTQACARLGVSQRVFAALVKSGDLPSMKTGLARTSRRLVKESDLAAVLDRPRRRPGRPARQSLEPPAPEPSAAVETYDPGPEPEPEPAPQCDSLASFLDSATQRIATGYISQDIKLSEPVPRPVNMLMHGRDTSEDNRSAKRNGSPFRQIDVAAEAARYIRDLCQAFAGDADVVECRTQSSPAQAQDLARRIGAHAANWTVAVKPRGQYQVIEVTES